MPRKNRKKTQQIQHTNTADKFVHINWLNNKFKCKTPVKCWQLKKRNLLQVWYHFQLPISRTGAQKQFQSRRNLMG